MTKGFTQREEIDFKETLSLVSMKDSFRTIMALVTHFDFELYQMDIKIVFLNGDIDKIIYMVQPKNFVSRDLKNMVCKLEKSIYELKQASNSGTTSFTKQLSHLVLKQMLLMIMCIKNLSGVNLCSQYYMLMIYYLSTMIQACCMKPKKFYLRILR